jgi:hypothetical protein
MSGSSLISCLRQLTIAVSSCSKALLTDSPSLSLVRIVRTALTLARPQALGPPDEYWLVLRNEIMACSIVVVEALLRIFKLDRVMVRFKLLPHGQRHCR